MDTIKDGNGTAFAMRAPVVARAPRPGPILLKSKYAGNCTACDGPYNAGEMVYWTKGVKGVVHDWCGVDEWELSMENPQP